MPTVFSTVGTNGISQYRKPLTWDRRQFIMLLSETLTVEVLLIVSTCNFFVPFYRIYSAVRRGFPLSRMTTNNQISL